MKNRGYTLLICANNFDYISEIILTCFVNCDHNLVKCGHKVYIVVTTGRTQL